MVNIITQLDSLSAKALEDEVLAIQNLLARIAPLAALDAGIRACAETLIAKQRALGPGTTIEAFLQTYGLSTKEGIAMLCLAEALLRIPDATTADALIEDTFQSGNWKQHLGEGETTLMQASSWALMLTGGVLKLGQEESVAGWFGGLIKRAGEPVIRQALKAGMGFIGGHFVMGETIPAAIAHAAAAEERGYRISYDILGEGARTNAQAEHYLGAYLLAIGDIARGAPEGELLDRPGISVKLSALHPRYSYLQRDRVMIELLPRLKAIIREAMRHRIAIALDAEEATRLDLHLEIYHQLLCDPGFQNFDGIGFVLQAYQKRAIHAVPLLATMAKNAGRRLPVRLVKGAYWDSEIKTAQMEGLSGYPVFTRKEHTDVSYLACAMEMLASGDMIYPQFATHNALTVASIMALAHHAGRTPHDFEFQRLHGMGESLHDQLLSVEGDLLPFAPAQKYRSRIYAPVGAHKDLLAYLIRRLLENGANSSFVHLLLDQATPITSLTESPAAIILRHATIPNPLIPLPIDLYGNRKNSRGFNPGYRHEHARLEQTLKPLLTQKIEPPAVTSLCALDAIVASGQSAWKAWDDLGVTLRAEILRRAADGLEQAEMKFLSLLMREGKKTLTDALAELREAVDFCRYYAALAERVFIPQPLPGPTGENNILTLHGRGVFLCISPWNFPLAIFIGQIAAALVSGNSVLAKPAEQTPTIAAEAVHLLHTAGVPGEVLQLVVGEGETVGAALVNHPAISGVCFTGSTTVAKHINRQLASKDGPIVPFIAETGGQNVMIVDSSALLEQACDDIIGSAFGSAGQRCSALRAVFVQEDVAEDLKKLLIGAMDQLRLGNPTDLATDIGPVIDLEAKMKLNAHIAAMKNRAAWWHATPLPKDVAGDPCFVPPHLFALSNLDELTEEHFGPVLHFLTFKAAELDRVIAAIHATGFGLTFGLQTRLRGKMEAILRRVHVGNRYVNRSMIGAVVGVQPFGGEGMSGTGPKAGGPHYLLRFCHERCTSINTAAIGGNVELLR
jgi:RHH-type proline utilization regulon transcriptional repressor/proline dehydrogenase/delta 1-pyrroline-5-carboxylate dehydrogenase